MMELLVAAVCFFLVAVSIACGALSLFRIWELKKKQIKLIEDIRRSQLSSDEEIHQMRRSVSDMYRMIARLPND